MGRLDPGAGMGEGWKWVYGDVYVLVEEGVVRSAQSCESNAPGKKSAA